MSNIPDFDAYELTLLSRLADNSAYYRSCHTFIHDTVLNDMHDPETFSQKQIKWLWGIKRDLEAAA